MFNNFRLKILIIIYKYNVCAIKSIPARTTHIPFPARTTHIANPYEDHSYLPIPARTTHIANPCEDHLIAIY